MNLSEFMPILLFVSALVIVVVLIVTKSKTKQNQDSAINQKLFEELAQELKAEHTIMKGELDDIKETLNSINKMMKDVQ